MSWASELRREGHQEGHREGQREGRRQGILDLLRALGGQRFGPPPEERLATLDLPAVEAAAQRMLTATTWDEILGG